MAKFSWGHSFKELNEYLFDMYSKCTSSQQVIQAQNEYMASLEQESRDRKANKSTNYIDFSSDDDDNSFNANKPNDESSDDDSSDDSDDDSSDDSDDDSNDDIDHKADTVSGSNAQSKSYSKSKSNNKPSISTDANSYTEISDAIGSLQIDESSGPDSPIKKFATDKFGNTIEL
ncbi:Ribosome biogenesis protein TSR3 [Smittium culicis]|uniref:Ribosome biogenesis protein TSR3 n=1 Tax=Smittium culicis TaxID=133412 RepID=A0A1R1Y3V8_9FUNG|nr:Ribosome biogenesis protein TSR3 [Smittium culicis]